MKKKIVRFLKREKLFIILVLAVILLGSTFTYVIIQNMQRTQELNTVFPSGARFVQNQMVVKYKTGESPQALEAQNKTVELQKLQNALGKLGVVSQSKLFSASNSILENYYVLQLGSGVTAKTIYPKLASIPQIDIAVPNYILSIQDTPNDPLYPGMWNLTQIKMSSAWNTTHGSAKSIIGVVDTGADYAHPDLVQTVIKGWNFVGNNNDPKDDNGHGTHVAGTIGAVTNNGIGIAGVTWGAKVLAVKACDANGDCDTTQVAQGIKYAVDNGAKIINISITGDGICQGTYSDVVSYAASKNVLIVAAAGNHNKNASLEIPGTCSKVLAVGAVAASGARAGYSNFGGKVAIAAPGGDKGSSACTEATCIVSTALGGGYEARAGTSMASPHVAGVAGLLVSLRPDLSANQIAKCLTDNAVKITTDKPIGAEVDAAKTLVKCSKKQKKPVASPTNSPLGLSGVVYVDANGNSRRNTTEAVVPNAIIRITGPVARTVKTNVNGGYSFIGLSQGTYTVTISDADSNRIADPITVTISKQPIAVDFPIDADILSELPEQNTPIFPGGKTSGKTSSVKCTIDPKCDPQHTIGICALICN